MDDFRPENIGCRIAGHDYNGYLWLWDEKNQQLFVFDDEGDAETRGYHCPTLEEAIRRVENEEVP